MKKTIDLLSDLVAFGCLGGESNLPIANYIEAVFQQYNIHYHRVMDETGKKMALHCRIGPAAEGGVILSGHTDVVPVEGQPWTQSPFKLTQEGTKLYARGSTDMKGFIACCLAMIPEMLKAPLKRPIYLAFSYDEEVICLGAPDLIKDIHATYIPKPSYAIIGEPTMMQTVTGEKGICAFTTTVYSSAAHSSQVRSSVSAIEESTYLIQWLTAKMDQLIKKGHVDNRFKPPHTTIHVGVIQGGIAVNIIADKCWFEWDVRNIPMDIIQTIVQDFEAYCKERVELKQGINPNFDIKTVPNFPIVPSLDTDATTDFVEIINQCNGTKIVGTVSYGSEAGQYAESGFEVVVCGPGNINRAHKADEYIKISELEACEEFLKKLIVWCSK